MKITVYDYAGVRFGCAAHQDSSHYTSQEPFIFEPDAKVVGGIDGVRAYWVENEMLYTAHGDDGHWWLGSVINATWMTAMVSAMKSVHKKK